MKKIKNICIISRGYPTASHPIYTFVEQLCVALSREGVSVTVISPQSLTSALIKGTPKHPKKWVYKRGGLPITVYQPFIPTVPYRFFSINNWFYSRIVTKFLNRLDTNFDAIYGHFWPSALYAFDYAKKHSIPLFVACGEGDLRSYQNQYSTKEYARLAQYVRGVISVSSNNKEIAIEMGLANKENCEVFPNGIDESLFKINDKQLLRKEYGFSTDDFILAFVGGFIHRKGPDRVAEAVSNFGDKDIKSFFVGSGQGKENVPIECDGVLFKGKVEHDKLSDYLNMSDIFVLPTLNEGCSNAIVEALACGLPVISSDLPFNKDILDSSNSILIDPMNVGQIGQAIKRLKEDENERNRLSRGAILRSKELGISNRCRRVLNFMEERM